eukprot:12386743-Ditylum_brightwellii.AAC.1
MHRLPHRNPSYLICCKVGSVCQSICPYYYTKGVTDSSATCHILTELQCFPNIKYTPSAYVILADKTKVPSDGIGTAKLNIGIHIILVLDCLYIPSYATHYISSTTTIVTKVDDSVDYHVTMMQATESSPIKFDDAQSIIFPPSMAMFPSARVIHIHPQDRVNSLVPQCA